MDVATWEAWWQRHGQSALLAGLRGGWLTQQRWFGGKARSMQSLGITSHAWSQGPVPLLFTWLEVRYADGGQDQYFLPLTVSSDVPSHAIVARAEGAPGGAAQLSDAIASDAAVRE